MNAIAKAKKISSKGNTPVYEYRKIRIVNGSGVIAPKVWVFQIDGIDGFSTSLKGAISQIDYKLNKAVN
jgi:hypothetical protein